MYCGQEAASGVLLELPELAVPVHVPQAPVLTVAVFVTVDFDGSHEPHEAELADAVD